MKNFKPFMKRVCAYTIDMFIVLTISSLISSLPLFNKHMKEYNKTYSEYEEKYNNYSEYIKLLDISYKDKEINEEEYNKLIESEIYSEFITSKYDDNKISKDEYSNLVEEINKKFDNLSKEYIYLLGKKGISNSIVTLVCTLLYFGVIQYFLKGKTLGKKILKLQIVSATEKKISILNYLLRSLVVNEILLNTIGLTFLWYTSKTVYMKADNILNILTSVVEAIIIYLVLTRSDGRGLHDLLFNTKVVSVENKEEKNKVIEATYKEETNNE